jgi:hypothetical protein
LSAGFQTIAPTSPSFGNLSLDAALRMQSIFVNVNLYYSRLGRQARIRFLAYLAEKPVTRPLAENMDRLE